MPSYARRTDKNQQEIVKLLRRIPGVSVFDLSGVGNGCPDVLIGFRGVNILIEIKRGRGRKTDPQHLFALTWNGQTAVAHNFEQALSIIFKITDAIYQRKLFEEGCG